MFAATLHISVSQNYINPHSCRPVILEKMVYLVLTCIVMVKVKGIYCHIYEKFP